ncbi:LamG domain-containing protein [Actinoallomurus soli]|uniref:LamG domain-containing protein n=1 Tax=Actinoallomurus soli TaxID=2952535 RepID=UPI002092392E|nr:LamG domain-containing protein [Actinoallomurus soli]MCO5974918.1 LamG domain-containing protein [Actinoallomurus soli]
MKPDSDGPSGPGGSARGSLRRGQWATPPATDRPDGKAGEDGDVTRPAARAPRRVPLAAVGLAAAALLVGLGGVFAVEVHGHRNDTSDGASQNMAANSKVAPDHSVQQQLPSATPSRSEAPKKQQQQKQQQQKQQSPTPTKQRTAPHQTGPAPVAFWRIGSGSGALGTEETNAFPAAVYDVARGSGHGGSGIFNGKDSQLTTAGPVVGTGPGQSFTVSAWVYLTSTAHFATAVSQDGGTWSTFYLQYVKTGNRWAFSRNTRSLSSAAPRLRTWTHLVGVYDAGGGQVTLYVNGVRQSTTHDTSPVSSTGDLAIGRAKANGKDADWFPGQINDVKVFSTALTAAQIRKI